MKRSSDTRIRRAVVGQMLDYAANAVVYWPVERIQSQFEANCHDSNLDPGQLLTEFLGELAAEEFWERVKTNLQAGKVRLVFVADVIPNELRRVVEFLNSQMNPAEVLAVEIRQYMGKGLRTLVPRVIGRIAIKEPPSSRGEKWTRDRFFKALELETTASAEEISVVQNLLEFGRELTGRDVEWGSGKERGSFTARLIVGTDRFGLFSVYTTGELSVNLGWNKRTGEELSEKYRQCVGEQLGFKFDARTWNAGWPMIRLSTLTPADLQRFKEVIQEFAKDVRLRRENSV